MPVDLSEAIELTNFFIDTVKPTEQQENVEIQGGIQIVRYSVLAPNAEEALKRFIEDEAGLEVERTPPTDMIIVGISDSPNPFA